MSTSSLLEKSEAYLHVHLATPGSEAEPDAPGPFITISRESGAGGSMFARALAESLPRAGEASWTVYGSNLIAEMLRAHHLSPRLARFLPEDRVNELDASLGELIGLHPNLWTLINETNDLVRQLAGAGHAILVGRGANFATQGFPGGINVRLVGSAGFRAANTARWLSLSPAAAATHNALRDAARRRYVRSVFDADIADPAAYDLVFNVERMSLETMVGVVSHLVNQKIARRDLSHLPPA